MVLPRKQEIGLPHTQKWFYHTNKKTILPHTQKMILPHTQK
jgi:hypothetical protein